MTEKDRPAPTDPAVHPPRPKRRWRRSLARLGAALLLLFIAAELVARFGFGMGDPVQYIADPEIEYLMRPSMRYHRIGGAFNVNAYSMRSDDFPARKTDPRELRVMVIGDSVVNGNSPVGQEQLATSILERRLRSELGRPVVVGNISGASWGPGNQLAYARRFGFFDADVVVIVLSSHDATDAPTFEPVVGVDPNMPSHKPVLALQEAVFRYLPRYLPGWIKRAPAATPATAATRSASAPLEDLSELIRRARAGGAAVAIVQHLERGEVESEPKLGHAEILMLAESEGVPVVQLGPAERAALAAGTSPYQDNVHLNVAGQQLLADRLHETVSRVLPVERPAMPRQ